LATLDRERQVCDRDDVAVALDQPLGLDHRTRRRHAAPRVRVALRRPAIPSTPSTPNPTAGSQLPRGCGSPATDSVPPAPGARATLGKWSTASLGTSAGNTRSATPSAATAGLFARMVRSGYCLDMNANAVTGLYGTSLTPSLSRS